MTEKPNILVVCGRNKKRSRTAEHIFKNDARFHIRSAGVSPQSERKISENDLNWADIVLVMENNHKNKIQKIYTHLELPLIEVLEIEDIYEFMDEYLIEILTNDLNQILKNFFE